VALYLHSLHVFRDDFAFSPDPSSRTVDLGSTQKLTEISSRNLPGGKHWPVREADSLTAIYELIAYTCMSLDALHTHGPPWSVTGMSLRTVYR
jgi:hypothetical protein